MWFLSAAWAIGPKMASWHVYPVYHWEGSRGVTWHLLESQHRVCCLDYTAHQPWWSEYHWLCLKIRLLKLRNRNDWIELQILNFISKIRKKNKQPGIRNDSFQCFPFKKKSAFWNPWPGKSWRRWRRHCWPSWIQGVLPWLRRGVGVVVGDRWTCWPREISTPKVLEKRNHFLKLNLDPG